MSLKVIIILIIKKKMDTKYIHVIGKRIITTQRKRRKEICYNFFLKEIIILGISLILSVSNMKRKGMRRSIVLSNFLEFLLHVTRG